MFFLFVFNPLFLKKRFLFFFRKKQTKTYSELFLLNHAVSPYSELDNHNFLYLLWHSNVRVKKCTPSSFSQNVVGQFTLKW